MDTKNNWRSTLNLKWHKGTFKYYVTICLNGICKFLLKTGRGEKNLQPTSLLKRYVIFEWPLIAFSSMQCTPPAPQNPSGHRITTVLSLFCFKRIKNVKIMQISNLSLSQVLDYSLIFIWFSLTQSNLFLIKDRLIYLFLYICKCK